MPSGVRVPPTSAPFAFDVLDCTAVAAGRAPARWRLVGRTADGRRLLLDFDAEAPAAAAGAAGAGAAVAPSLPSRLTRATVAQAAHAAAATPVDRVPGAVADAAGEPRRVWVIQADQGRFDLGAARLFVHEDVSALAAAAVPPRPVPLGKRLFWRAVFALLATRAGRRWLERRAAA
jgi:hypothetical protein